MVEFKVVIGDVKSGKCHQKVVPQEETKVAEESTDSFSVALIILSSRRLLPLTISWSLIILYRVFKLNSFLSFRFFIVVEFNVLKIILVVSRYK